MSLALQEKGQEGTEPPPTVTDQAGHLNSARFAGRREKENVSTCFVAGERNRRQGARR
jgi:hypothetical protein